MRATLAAFREPAGKLWLCKVLYVFEQKRIIF